MRAKLLSGILFSVAAVGLLLGVVWLIHLRFETGQAYPDGSSLRSDPVGAKVLFDSYAALDELRVERNFAPFPELDDLPANAVLLMLNVRGWELYELAQYESIRQFVSGGGRLVVALNPESIFYEPANDETSDQDPEDEPAEEEAVEKEQEEAEDSSPFAQRANDNRKAFWDELELRYGKHDGGNAQLTTAADTQRLPQALPWRKGNVLDALGEEWTPLYKIDQEAVVAERVFGLGSIVLMTDYYLLSNEALLVHRYTDLLTWIFGDARTVIFDETHLGVSERTGIAILMRRYHLEGMLLAFAVLCALIVWRGVSPLLPPNAARPEENVVFAGHSTEAGLGDLVRSVTSAVDLPREAFQQWKQSFIRNATDAANYAKEIEAVQALLSKYAEQPKGKRKPLELHLSIKNIINRKKKNPL